MAPHPATPTPGLRHSLSQKPIQSPLNINSPSTPLQIVTSINSTSNVTFTPLLFLADSVFLMLLLTRRWLGAYFSLGSVGWLWHSNIASRGAPDNWSSGEYENAEKALSGWNAAVCKGVGICGNAFGSSREAEEKKVKVKEERPSVPEYVIDYGGLIFWP